jgi:hypothetical protein
MDTQRRKADTGNEGAETSEYMEEISIVATAFQEQTNHLAENDKKFKAILYSFIDAMYSLLETATHNSDAFREIQTSDYWTNKRQKPKESNTAKWVVDVIMQPKTSLSVENATRLSAIFRNFLRSNVPKDEVKTKILADGGIQRCYLKICPKAIARADLDLLRTELVLGTMPPPIEGLNDEDCDTSSEGNAPSRASAQSLQQAEPIDAADSVTLTPSMDSGGLEADQRDASSISATQLDNRHSDMHCDDKSSRRETIPLKRKDQDKYLAVEMNTSDLETLLMAKRAVIRVVIESPIDIDFKRVIAERLTTSFSDRERWPDIRFTPDRDEPTIDEE